MKKSEEDTKIKGFFYNIIFIEWEIINKKISELQLSQFDNENIKNEIKRREAEILRNK